MKITKDFNPFEPLEAEIVSANWVHTSDYIFRLLPIGVLSPFLRMLDGVAHHTIDAHVRNTTFKHLPRPLKSLAQF